MGYNVKYPMGYILIINYCRIGRVIRALCSKRAI
jgi:hypothetical protein